MLRKSYWWCYRLWHNRIRYFHKEIKWFYQRGKRGWSDSDVWSLDYYLAKVISEGVKHLAEHNIGCPHDYFDETKDDQCHEWDELLKRIAKGFDDYLKVQNFDIGFDDNKTQEENEKIREEIYKEIEECKKLLMENFEGLWW